MKHKILIFCFLCFICYISNAQVKYNPRIYFYPLGIDIGNINYEEHGLGTYDFNKLHTNNIEIGFILGVKLIDDFYFDFGLNFKKLKYEFEFVIDDPFISDEILFTENRHITKLMYSPNVGLMFSRKKYSMTVGCEPNLEIRSNGNIETVFSETYVFIDPITHQSAYFSYEERPLFLNSFELLFTPTLKLNYEIIPKLSIDLCAKLKPYGKFYLYQLKIQGKTAEMPDGIYILNDSRINNKMIYAFLGISYSLSKHNIH